ncbi:hypothetical protein B0O99DRAFT_636447 [Bisporella sp. PMI_857]|nr:hypothetical protein B0O99DRAFT_636447 [Bisporella sp. PMI_857]
MFSAFRNLYNSFPKLRISMTSPTKDDPLGYSPSVEDVLAFKDLLLNQFDLPLELIDTIVDYAEYWPHTSTTTNTSSSVMAGRDGENRFILRSYPLGFVPNQELEDPGQMLSQYRISYQYMEPKPWPESRTVPHTATEEVFKLWLAKSRPRNKHPCRKIVFRLKSYDQGWGGNPDDRGTYRGSMTWFDVGIEKVSATKETTLLEAWELAPFPQFRLNGDLYEPQEDPNVSRPPLVCSLRTIKPPTIATPKEIDPIFEPPFKKQEDGEDMDPNTPSSPQNPFSGTVPQPPPKQQTVYKFDHHLLSSDDTLQHNLSATRESREYTITWSCDDHIHPETPEANALREIGRGGATANGDYVRNMEVGDVVTVWAKARFPGWVNNVQDVSIDLYWAV